jgi:hypothetical protein
VGSKDKRLIIIGFYPLIGVFQIYAEIRARLLGAGEDDALAETDVLNT